MKKSLLLLALFAASSSAWAALNVSVIALDGGPNLRLEEGFSAAANKKELRVRVSSTGGRRFQVFERLEGPISNEKGEALNPQAFLMQSLPISNAGGTLYAQNPQPLSMSEELVYSSSDTGQSDSFILGYSLRPELLNASGNFQGRLVVTARGSDGDSQAVMDIFVKAQGNLKVSVAGSRSPSRISISDNGDARSADFVKVSFSGNQGEVRIYQETLAVPQNSEGQTLENGVIKVEPEGGRSGVKPAGLDQGRELIYSSQADEDAFELHFLTDPDAVSGQEPGDYTGRVKYIVETGGGKTQEFPLDVALRIQPVFTMEVLPPEQGLNFGRVSLLQPPQVKEFTVKVHSNLHKPYQVSQNLQAPMANEKGMEFDPKYFTFRVDIPADQRGKTKYGDFLPVKTGEYPVFSSDSKGSPATFKVVYRLQGYSQMNIGTFAAPIRFSLDQN